jgi:hypothetical protein
MRIVWLLGGDAQAKKNLERALATQSPATEYSVRMASAISDISEDDLMHPGVVMVCDAFHPTYPAFEGIKALRATGFSGPLFLSGEPSPELSVAPFLQHALAGYVPSFDRLDFSFFAGLIHHQIFFDGTLAIEKFLEHGGRSSSEVVRTFKDFNQFGAKLATFVQKFGIDVNQVRKLLMGLGLPHIKGSASGPSVDQSFTLYYGIDAHKLVLGVTAFSRGSTREALLSDFTSVLAGHKDQKALPGTIFPELFHVARAVNNLVLISGSAKQPVQNLDPLFLVAAIPFPQVANKPQGPINLFSFVYVQPTAEIEKRAEEEPLPLSAEVAPPSQAQSVSAEAQPEGMIGNVDMDGILNEPVIMGDQPTFVDSDAARSASPSNRAPTQPLPSSKPLGDVGSTFNSVAPSSGEGEELDPATQAELVRLREVCAAMSADIRRLMKERRVPSTDRELRDAVVQLEEKLKKQIAEKSRVNKLYEDAVMEVNSLKLQMEAIKTNKAA